MKTKNQFDFNLSKGYIISKFYQLGYKVSYNSFQDHYRSCCPICREGKSWGSKFRCYYIPENNNVYCHNCGSSLTPYQWIREVSGMTHEQLVNDYNKFDGENTGINFNIIEDSSTNTPIVPHTLPEECINLFDPIQVQYYKDNNIVKLALDVVEKRRLKTALNSPDSLFLSLKDKTHKNRIIIPFKNSDGKIIYYQSRSILPNDEKGRFLSKVKSEKSIFGMEKIDVNYDYVFIFEGPIDSFFVKNGIAVAGISYGKHKFTKTQQIQMDELVLFKKIWVLDNQWIDKTAKDKTLSLLEMNECVFFWPKKYQKYKDLNDLCVSKNINGISPEFIKKNSYCGNTGILKHKLFFK